MNLEQDLIGTSDRTFMILWAVWRAAHEARSFAKEGPPFPLEINSGQVHAALADELIFRGFHSDHRRLPAIGVALP